MSELEDADTSPGIAYIITSLAVGGAQNVLVRLLKGKPADYKPCCIIVLRHEPGIEAHIRALGIPVFHLDVNKPWYLPYRLLKLQRYLRHQPIQVLSSIMPHANLLAVVIQWLNKGRWRLIWNLHNTPDDGLYSRWDHRLILWLSYYTAQWAPNRIVVVSERSQARYLELGYPPDKLVLIHNGIPVGSSANKAIKTCRQQVRTELGLTQQTRLIGSLTRYVPAKNIPLLLQAFRYLLDRYGDTLPPVCLLLAGERMTTDNADLQRLIRSHQLSGHVLTLGIRDDAPRLIRALDIATLSSRSESLPLFMAEAMAAGIPCVATDVGDMALLLGETGWLVPSEQAGPLADAWLEVLQLSEHERLQQAGLSQQRIEQVYSVDVMLEKYAVVYNPVRL